MRLIALRMFRFGSFETEQEFKFPEGAGLYHMSGPNGAGKSTVWKALTWVLFGKDYNGMRAGDVANWEHPKGAWVELDFEHGEGTWMQYTVRRSHSPNAWTLQNVFDKPQDLAAGDGAANPLMSMLRLEYEPFLATVLLAQGRQMFLDLKPEPKAALFTSVMGLERWDGYSDSARDRQRAAEASERAASERLAGIEGQLARIDASSLAGPMADWEDARAKRLSALTDGYARALVEEGKLKALVEPAAREHVNAQKNRQGFLVNYESKIKAKDDASAAVNRINEELAVVEDRSEQWIGMRMKLKGARACPTCGSTDRLGNVLKDIEGNIAALDAEELRIRSRREKAVASRDMAMADWDRSGTLGDAARARLEKAARAEQEAKLAWEAVSRQLDGMEAQADDIKREVNPYARIQDAAERDHARLVVDRDMVVRERDEHAERASLLGFWVRGFKDVRLLQIADALDELAIEANSATEALGLASWELAFEVDRETKSGAVQRGFNAFIRSPKNDRQVPWESWSGGEAQRLRVAAQAGFSDLTRNQRGIDLPLEVWDEPTDGMNAEGIDRLLEFLSDRARERQRQIWVIDHRALGSGRFDGGVAVTKEPGGSMLT